MELTPEAESVIMNFRWPGNIRQLKNVAEQVAVLEQADLITADMMRNYLPASGTSSNLPALYRIQDPVTSPFLNETSSTRF